MDNITHTLMGVTLAVSVARGDNVPPRSQAILAAVVASNLPDFDFLFGFLYRGGNLGYLMQHRGWTHTLVAAPAVALVSLGIMSWITGRDVGEPLKDRAKKVGESTITRMLRGAYSRKHDSEDPKIRAKKRLGRLRLFLLALAAVFFHIFADWWNDYGVHPFVPFDNNWYFGDFIFILEPMIWVTFLPFIFWEFKNRLAKVATAAIAVLGLAVALLGAQGGITAALALGFWGALCLLCHQRFDHRLPRAALTCILVMALLLTFRTSGAIARSVVTENLATQTEGEKIQQLIVSPFPSNPSLWRTLVVTTGSRGYVARLGTVSLLSAFQAPPSEFYGIKLERLAPLAAPSVASSLSVNWLGEFRGTVLELVNLSVSSCEFATLLKFSRAPFWMHESGRIIGGDLRYDQERGMGFTKVLLRAPDSPIFGNCPDYDAPWNPPLPISKLE